MDIPNTQLSQVAAYCRCATPNQVSLSRQRQQVEAEATKRGDTIGEFFADAPASGGSLDRAELQRLREAVKAGLVKRLYVASLDRLTRSPSELSLLLNEFEDSGASVVFPGESR